MKTKYDEIGIDYNQTRKADAFLLDRLWFHLNASIEKQFLDIGCGTGNYTIELNRRGLSLIGVDPSEEMLKIARSKNDRIDWRPGKAEAIPVADECIDGVVASLTLHHWIDLNRGFNELHRILKPDGNLVIFTSTPRQMQGYWLV